MRTVSTLCASGAGIGIGSVGLAVVRDASPSARGQQPQPQQQPQRPPSSLAPRPTTEEMTAVATYARPQQFQFDLDPPFRFSTPPARSVSDGQQQQPQTQTPPPQHNGQARPASGKARSGEARVGEKRTLTSTPRASFSMASERPPTRDARDHNDADTSTGASLAGTPSALPLPPPRSWLRRLSSSMSSSRESSQPSHSRPGSQSAGSMAVSYSGSTTPIFADTRTPPPAQPNKLVKRASSVRSTNRSPLTSSGSRLPMPVFRRPATSHQRSATMQEQLRVAEDVSRVDLDGSTPSARGTSFTQYFTPKVAADEDSVTRRRSSTAIPNPVKRVYPDRKYTPILVSARHVIRPAEPELDGSVSEDEAGGDVIKLALSSSVDSSPLPTQAPHFGDGPAAKRSFSIGDLLSTGPQTPLWRRPSQRQSRSSSAKLVRKARPRVTSAPHSAMGGSLSRSTGVDSEPPAKRRDITDPQSGQRSIYSSSSGIPAAYDIDLNLATDTPSHHSYGTPTPSAETGGFTRDLSPIGQPRLPSATEVSTAQRAIRVSAAQSEINSTVSSDSDVRSVGDASTDYQSDTVYDSYPTRTTRSSSGKRGPHIESIFDDSPPAFSSGRSTRLKDLLSDSTYSGEHASRYRHSTIEEEGSIVSTPVRSLHTQSVTSTPSARPGAQKLFGSSPPIPVRTEPDDVDWDAFDDDGAGLGIGQNPHAFSETPQRSLPFRFGPALQHSLNGTAHTTPQRGNGDKANLFEWAEVQPSPSHNQSPPRPRTVHGKKDQDARGSRATGRRAPSGMHARSHSVPVVPDTDGKRTNAANKFGTWGVGSKAVTEDWNEDFDFEEPGINTVEIAKQDDRRIDSGHDMFVPRSIREQQENVVANIGLLREWGLLIEELKELRVRATALDMLSGQHAQDWYEVDAMIELADQETEEKTLAPRRSPPSSPGFDIDVFDEPMPNIASTADIPPLTDDDISESETLGMQSQPGTTPATPLQPRAITRPRKDSEAVARSVIEALQSRRSFSDPAARRAAPPVKKVPFDTATLRHIVPYVNGLKRKVKEALRQKEGLYSSPRRRGPPHVEDDEEMDDQQPAFRTIFNEPESTASSDLRRSRREDAATDHDGGEVGDLTKRLRNMKFPE